MAVVGARALLTLEEARIYLKQTDTTDNDPLIAEFVDRVTGAIEIYTKRKLLSRPYDGSPGNEPVMLLSGRGSSEIGLRETPVTTVTSVLVRYPDGTTTRNLVLTGMRLLYGGRRLLLPYDSFGHGQNNIEVTCVAGYLATLHPSEIQTLKLAASRYLQVMWQDRLLSLGRGQTFGVGDNSVSLLPDDLPKDVKTLLRNFERWI